MNIDDMMNPAMSFMNECTAKVLKEIEEQEDEWVVKQILPWTENEMRMKISKNDLIKAVKMYYGKSGERHAKWMDVPDDRTCFMRMCSACNAVTRSCNADVGCNWNALYCPNCGAKMDLKGSEYDDH